MFLVLLISAVHALDEARLVAAGALEGDEFEGEVVTMDRFLGAIADGAGKKSEASTGVTQTGRRCSLQGHVRSGQNSLTETEWVVGFYF